MNRSELKRELIALLRDDEEFRLAIAGLLGLESLLNELRRLREDFNNFVREQEKRWEEAYKRFEAIELELKRLREDFNKLYESVTKRIDLFEKRLVALGARWGIETEEAFREGMRGVIEEILGVSRVEKWVYRDDSGEIYGFPSTVEVDLVIKDNTHILIEIKSSVSRSDVVLFWRIGRLYERVVGVKPRLVMISPYVDEKALRAATELGVEIYTS